MRALKKNLIIFTFFLGISPLSIASEEILINLRGSYLAYSYDYNQVYGENVEFKFFSYNVSCQYIKVDISSRVFYAYGDVVLKKDDEKLQGDEFLFNPKDNRGMLISYLDKVEVRKIGSKKDQTIFEKSPVLDELSLSKIQKSFIYFTGQSMEITTKFEVYGYNTTIYVEGLESVGFKKFKLSGGVKKGKKEISIDKIWYTRSQGIIGRASYVYEKENKINSLTQLNYEEHSVLKDYHGLKRQVDIITSTTANLSESLNVSLTANYNSSSLWNSRFLLNKKWNDKIHTQVDFSYNKPINLKGETWFGFGSSMNAEKFGTISFAGRYELQNQILANFSYTNTFLNKINFLLSSSYSKIRIGGSDDYSRIFSGGVGLSYSSQIFNLSTDYYLNHDLFGNQLLSQPRLMIGLNPFSFYNGLLTASISNVFIYNKLKSDGIHDHSYSNNTVFSFSTQPIFIQKSFSLNFNIALEQFLEREGRNFTSSGFIINANKEISKAISLEGFYSIHSRRKTKGWLIEGTTSQDLSAIAKFNPSERFNGWVSFSFDPKSSQWRQSFADISIGIIKNWKFHSLLNYDFLLKKINNIDLYLIREAGRFQLRFIWRSLSKQFLVELVPR